MPDKRNREHILHRTQTYILDATRDGRVSKSPTRIELVDLMVPLWQRMSGSERRQLTIALNAAGFNDISLLENVLLYASRTIRNQYSSAGQAKARAGWQTVKANFGSPLSRTRRRRKRRASGKPPKRGTPLSLDDFDEVFDASAVHLTKQVRQSYAEIAGLDDAEDFVLDTAIRAAASMFNSHNATLRQDNYFEIVYGGCIWRVSPDCRALVRADHERVRRTTKSSSSKNASRKERLRGKNPEQNTLTPTPVVRGVTGNGRPAPNCKHCGGLTVLSGYFTSCSSVEMAEEHWRCVKPRCRGSRDATVHRYPLSEYNRRG
ncbi:hypothetical protein [Mycolicibacterium elephantis]|uniref:hypothetical protein n=1 Tax=Mycolicibacterium elephantis TaxID=81858 RepID=UPI000B0BC0C8|nr:hypothetical protein [Mycolicibacterium elephantis]